MQPHRIGLMLGDITTAPVDAIVNAANSGLLGGGGVDGSIHAAAGPELAAACRRLPAENGRRCPPGQARITPGFALRARHVIHAVGPKYHEHPDPAGCLASAYRHSLSLAMENHCESVALPAISCGVYGYPPEEAATIALATCGARDFAPLNITFYLFNEAMFSTWLTVRGP